MEKAKICIITARNIYDSPCLDKYGKIITQPCDIIYWDRHGIEESCFSINQYKYNGIMDSNAGKIEKITHYLKFRRFVKKVLKRNRYDCLIIFPSHTAWLILGILTKMYRGKYVLDIRDYSGEHNPLIYRMTKKAIENSGLCTVTSRAYENFLPKHAYVVSHNVQEIDIDLIKNYRQREKTDKKIVLSFIGTIRFIEQQKKLIYRFNNDERFTLQFIGRGSEQLETYCREIGAKNVVLKGRFERSELPNYYLSTDMAINIYGNNDPFLDYALSNKLYSAALMGMPILCSPNTYMTEIAEKYGFGCAVDLDDEDCVNKVFNYFSKVDFSKLYKGCDQFMSDVLKEEKEYALKLESYLMSTCK